jgi:hypothetical protein
MEKFREISTRVYLFFSETRGRSWLGHAVQGLGLQTPFFLISGAIGSLFPCFLGLMFNLGWWSQREVIADYVEQIPELGLRKAGKKFLDDNWMDLLFPMMAAVLLTVVAAILI